MATRKSAPRRDAAAGKRAARLLNEKVLDVLERLLDTGDDKVQLAAAKEIKEIARQNEAADPGENAGQNRVFVVTGIERQPGDD